MALFVPYGADFQWQYSTTQNTQPAAAFGVAVTAGVTPTKGAWVQVGSSANISQEVYGVLININSAATSAATRNYHVDLGVDTAGGTSYLVKIPNLLGGHAAPYNVGSGGIWYYFPLYIPRNSSVAIRAAGNVTTAIRANVTFFGQPRRPDAVRCGSKVFSFGENTANATGTAITLGTAAEGGWTQVGSATPQSLWWWQTGYTAADTTMTLQAIHLDVGAGDATNKKLLLENQLITVTTTEQINNIPQSVINAYNNVAEGELIYVRGRSSATPDTATSVMAWGLGG